jgi:organic hydroperoxide reductase OsmC/OhrA
MNHEYLATIEWTGNRGTGTSGYTDYDRSHTISVDGKINIEASSDPHFKGDATKYNPEDMFLTSIASCHMLWYLHLCADNGIIVQAYTDYPYGLMVTGANGSGQFTKIELRPIVTVENKQTTQLAADLHHKAHEMCFLSNSVNFEIIIKPEIKHL